MNFDWDENKREANLRKHGIDFADLEALFGGVVVTVEDARFSYGESRYITIGLVKGRSVVVAHTERGGKIRIISARRASKNEEIAYWAQVTNRLGASRRSRSRKH